MLILFSRTQMHYVSLGLQALCITSLLSRYCSSTFVSQGRAQAARRLETAMFMSARRLKPPLSDSGFSTCPLGFSHDLCDVIFSPGSMAIIGLHAASNSFEPPGRTAQLSHHGSW
ncbi:uncharacterized protein C8Q71DRAFT_62517 [Rhodofomes roseus]|uniref:Secreted protein n=1 Tax=Rhodofomes roseus TaxID=34475 RepID=A0ABQ8KHR2_9APHY|nr:uncharacterized protein C8Q71DRAFT_62517 [Rhodofomes roseus]KAH9836839.1 hypothetical protein C8Q71DRAFT_62517 [Rhodofomes roseus]